MAIINLSCIDCGKPFLFTDSEQAFYKEHNYVDPKRCWQCRQKYKASIGKGKPVSEECFDCNIKFRRGVATDAEHKCLACGRLIDQSDGRQYPVVRG